MVFPAKSRAPGSKENRERDEASHGRAGDVEVEKLAECFASLETEEVFNFLVGHGLPPIGIDDFNFPSHGSQATFSSGRNIGADQVNDRDTSATNGHGLPVLDSTKQFRQFLFGSGNTYAHAPS
jgi:hypothetical protein